MKPSTKGYLLAFVSTFFLGTTSIFIRYLTENFQLPAFVLAFWRDVFVVLTLFVFFGLTNPKLLILPKGKAVGYAVYGFVLAFFNIMWTFSVEQNGAAVATVLVYTSAAFTAILGRLFFREELGFVKILAVLISFVGCVLVSEAFDITIWKTLGFGITTGITAGLGYAVYSLMGRAFAQREINTWTTLIYTFAFAAVFLLIANFVGGRTMPGSVPSLEGFLWLGSSVEGWLVLFLVAAIPTVLGFGLYNASMQFLSSSVANLIATIEPVFTMVIAYLILGETLNQIQLLGSMLIICAVLMIRVLKTQRTFVLPMKKKKNISDSVQL